MALIATAIIGFSVIGTVFVYTNYRDRIGELKAKLFRKNTVRKEPKPVKKEVVEDKKDPKYEDGVLVAEFCGSSTHTANSIKQLVRNVFFDSEVFELVDVEVNSREYYTYSDFTVRVYYKKLSADGPNLKIKFWVDKDAAHIKING